ncbi:MAG TPA: hypothetical protein PLJ60_11630 [Chryseolinea sp.]|nr:hypothetical protein [Chryseolinea sp.]
MKKTSLLVIVLCFGFCQVNAQTALTKFKTEVCDCFQKMKPETINTATAVQKEIGTCFTAAALANQKQLKKSKAIDLDIATEDEISNLWKQIFEHCGDATSAVFDRVEVLENEAIAKSFQGVITYVQDIKLSASFEKMGLNKKKMIEEMNKEGSWFDTLIVVYQGGNYAKFGNNAKETTKIYVQEDNIIYAFSASDADVCSVQEAVDLDLSGNPDKPLVIELDSVATIMGIPCKIISVKWKLSQIDYYYSATQAQASPDLFSKHSSEGLAEFVSRTKCLPLQIVTSTMGMTIIQTAVEVKSVKIDEEVFSIPELVEDESLNAIALPGITMKRIKK